MHHDHAAPATDRRATGFHLVGLAALVAGLVLAEPSWASGFGLYEQTDGATGAGGVGAGATAADASTVYFNPAGMLRLPDDTAKLGFRYIDLSSNFSPSGPLLQGGGTGGDAGDKLPIASLFYSHRLGDDWAVGASFTQPFGLGLIYDPDWAGRYYVTKNVLKNYNFSLSAAYRVTPSLSLGGGLDVIYGTLDYGAAIDNVLDGLPDGRLDFGANDIALAYDLAALYEPVPGTRIGLTYRSRAQLDLSGNLHLGNVGPTLQFLGLSGTGGRLKVTLPDNATISLYQDIGGGTAVLADLGWMHWSLLRQTLLAFNSGFTEVTPRNWHDAYHFGVGLRHEFSPSLTGQIGLSWDTSPQSATYRLPDLLIDRQMRVGAGVDYRLTPALTIGASYEYANLGRNNIDAAIPLDGPLTGHADTRAHVFGVDASWVF